MKHVDVRPNVMNKVVRYEQKRTTAWYIQFVVVMVTIVMGLGAAAYWIISILKERQTFELLSLFVQDQEIIAEYWQDTVMIFLEELPRRPVMLAILLVILLIAFWVVTAKRRKRLARIRSQLERYEKKR